MLYRNELRDLAIQAVKEAKTIAGERVYSPRDWKTTSRHYPCVIFVGVEDNKTPLTRGPMDFTSTATIYISARAEGKSDDEVLSQVDALCEQIEKALFLYPPLLQKIQQFPFFKTRYEITAEGKKHLGEAQIIVGLEYFESFEIDGDEITEVDMRYVYPR